MMFHPINSIALALTLTIQCTVGQVFTGPQDLRVETALTLDVPCNGVSTTPDGRLFLVLARVDGSKGPAVVEYNRTTNEMTAYPNEAWNSYQDGDDPSTKFVRINSQRVGPDGHLYVVDAGSPSFGEPVILPEGPKLIQINVNTNEVSRVYPMGNVTRYNSLLDDVRFNPATGKAHLTDAGSPGLIVLDLASRIREESLRQVRNMAQKGRPQCQQKGRIWFNGKNFYFSPANGGLWKLETKWLDQAFYNTSLAGAELASYIEPYSLTPSTDGTAIDTNGVIYVSDTDSQRIISVAKNGTKSLLVQDSRLLWVDAMWIEGTKLWLPAAQLNRGTPFGNGQVNITKPLYVYTIDIGVGPSPIDHA
ncbi:hypothetical protein CLAFUW4_04987 [Fulvia fulva]|uniref:Major royal jelly protein n=1 Tax=Passalora fulva TaxID=5499 RepID=A0A9Q8PIN7_PASFU|nr:uncharacterized protein CLAFUR5_11920 [Fulvia fulva]KAK4627138.1 hypothetical protein CLAFUR4_04973 [Fulvia fulva]KAK4628542.1 hypothetical protein CLAFUR0_04977 [Fulvia fulva]UJO23205.1 hypothetical protein CLAFUR5_11920 [Fulvia fulva]WPV13568.1 hypothetical protein CLAFUW4_04987 [Fulvia fulva]WPV28059.1 hypothetical protein CLAFUW7_04981 [Fulvia fulva]